MNTKYNNLVLHIESYNEDEIENSIFVGYHHKTREFFLCGKCGQVEGKTDFVPFFLCGKYHSVISFLELIIHDDVCNITLYNYDNIPDFEDISYQFLIDNIDKKYEILGYDDVNIDSYIFKNTIRTCKDMYSYY